VRLRGDQGWQAFACAVVDLPSRRSYIRGHAFVASPLAALADRLVAASAACVRGLRFAAGARARPGWFVVCGSHPRRGGRAGAEIAEPFATLADPDLPQRLDGGAAGRTAASSGGGSNEALTVGATGFEPATFRPPAECATRLRHAPGRAEFTPRFDPRPVRTSVPSRFGWTRVRPSRSPGHAAVASRHRAAGKVMESSRPARRGANLRGCGRWRGNTSRPAPRGVPFVSFCRERRARFAAQRGGGPSPEPRPGPSAEMGVQERFMSTQIERAHLFAPEWERPRSACRHDSLRALLNQLSDAAD
jgi:hypothetical protein